MNLGDIRREFGNLPDEFELPLYVNGEKVRVKKVTREKIAGTIPKTVKATGKVGAIVGETVANENAESGEPDNS